MVFSCTFVHVTIRNDRQKYFGKKKIFNISLSKLVLRNFAGSNFSQVLIYSLTQPVQNTCAAGASAHHCVWAMSSTLLRSNQEKYPKTRFACAKSDIFNVLSWYFCSRAFVINGATSDDLETIWTDRQTFKPKKKLFFFFKIYRSNLNSKTSLLAFLNFFTEKRMEKQVRCCWECIPQCVNNK